MKNCLELRINSISDAKSIIRIAGKINKTLINLKLDNIEFRIANEIKVEVAALNVSGPFRCKTYNRYESTLDGNVFFQIPHYEERQPLTIPIRKESKMMVVEAPVVPGEPVSDLANIPITEQPPKKRGQPKGGWPKKVATP